MAFAKMLPLIIKPLPLAFQSSFPYFQTNLFLSLLISYSHLFSLTNILRLNSINCNKTIPSLILCSSLILTAISDNFAWPTNVAAWCTSNQLTPFSLPFTNNLTQTKFELHFSYQQTNKPSKQQTPLQYIPTTAYYICKQLHINQPSRNSIVISITFQN